MFVDTTDFLRVSGRWQNVAGTCKFKQEACKLEQHLFKSYILKKYPAAFDRIALHVTASNFEYYEVLEYKEFRGRVPDILEETISYKELCPTALKMHW